MKGKLSVGCFFILICTAVTLTSCSFTFFSANPRSVIVRSPCLVDSGWIILGPHSIWPSSVWLRAGPSYWLWVRSDWADTIVVEVYDNQGQWRLRRQSSGPKLGACFHVPRTGEYIIICYVTKFSSGFADARIKLCLSEFGCD
jgi:hypothetical protein